MWTRTAPEPTFRRPYAAWRDGVNNGKLQLNISLLNTPVRMKPTIKILGVTIESTLTMSSQVRDAAARIRQRCGALSAVGARSWGADTTTLRDLFTGYVRPAGTYAIGTWWPYAAPSVKARAEAANNTGARTVIGVPAGSKASATRHEAGLPSLEALGSLDAGLQLLHYRRFPPHHPLHDLAEPPPVATRQKARGGGTRGNWRETALAALNAAGLRDTRPQPLLPPDACPPPWEGLGENIFFHSTQGTSRDDPPEVRREAATRMMEEVRRADGDANIQVWTDGAADEGVTNGGAGAVIIWHDGRPNTTLAIPAGRICSSTAAEAAALAAGLREVRTNTDGHQGPLKIWAAFDSLALHDRLQSQDRHRADHQTAEAAGHLRALGQRHRVHVLWVPGHAGLPLNEDADEAAGRGSRMPQEDVLPTAAAVKAALKRRLPVISQQEYEAATPADLLHRRASGGHQLPEYDGRTRHTDVLLHQLRLNRPPYLFATKFKWGKVDSPTCPHCNDGEEDVDHFLLRCPRWAALRARVFGPSPDISILQQHASRVLEFLRGAGVAGRGHP